MYIIESNISFIYNIDYENKEKHDNSVIHYNPLLIIVFSVLRAILILNSAQLKRICRYRKNRNTKEVAWLGTIK